MTTNDIIKLNTEKCIGCGECTRVCPSQTLIVEHGKVCLTANRTMQCGHCAAVCPTGAISVSPLQHMRFATFETRTRWIPYGNFDVAALVQFMRSRRSCRNYTSQRVDRNLLEDLIQIGTTAPSGTNSQCWSFTILETRERVEKLGGLIAGYYKRLNALAEKRSVRIFSRLFMKGILNDYYKKYYQTVKTSLLAWEQHKKDSLFHCATAVIIVSASSTGSCPREDSLLATQNIITAAHALGLGSCLIGYAAIAIERDRDIKRILEIPQDESVYTVIALGHPDETYRWVTERKKIAPRFPQKFGIE